MLVKLDVLLEFLETEHARDPGHVIAKMLRGIATATPTSGLFASDPNRERAEELKQLRKLRDFFLKYADDTGKKMGDLKKAIEACQ
jgi:hypothetical protein